MGGDITYPLYSPHGDMWAATDDTGIVTETFSYDEYGNPLQPATGDESIDRYGWLARQQREWDPETQITLMGVRGYDPTMGRFLSVDPVYGGSANNYDYVGGDPINRFDLDGRWCMFGRNPDGSCRGGRVARAVKRGARSVGRGVRTVWRSTGRGIRAVDRYLHSRLCRYNPATGALLVTSAELVALPLHMARAGSAGGPEGTPRGR